MTGLPLLAHPQLVAAVLGVFNLGLALSLEVGILLLSLRYARRAEVSPLAGEHLPHDFYDWLYE